MNQYLHNFPLCAIVSVLFLYFYKLSLNSIRYLNAGLYFSTKICKNIIENNGWVVVPVFLVDLMYLT